MTHAARIVVTIAALALLPGLAAAQSEPAEPAPPQQEETAQPQSVPQAAPKKGHPLDPADVAVLTGRTRNRNRNPGYGAYGVPYPVYTGGGSRFARVTTATRPPFTIGAFGRFGDNSFVVIDGGGRLPFFFPGSRRAAAARFFLSPGFFFFGR